MIKKLIISAAVALTVVGSSHAFVPEPYSDIRRECNEKFPDNFEFAQNCIKLRIDVERSRKSVLEHEDKKWGWTILDFTKRLELDWGGGESEPLTLWENILGWSIILGIVFWFNRRKLVPWILEKTKDILRF